MANRMFKNDMSFKKFKNINVSIKLHSFVFYSPRDVNRIADNQFVCNPVDIPRTITHKKGSLMLI